MQTAINFAPAVVTQATAATVTTVLPAAPKTKNGVPLTKEEKDVVTARAVIASRKKYKGNLALQATQNTGWTIKDLTPAHIVEAYKYAQRVWGRGATDRQKKMDSVNEACSEALLALYKGQYLVINKETGDKFMRGVQPWDSERGAFHVYFAKIAYSKLTKVGKVERMSESYSHAVNQGDEVAPVFNYYNAAETSDGQANADTILTAINSALTPKESKILALMLVDTPDFEICEQLNMSTTNQCGALRKAKSYIRAKVEKMGFKF